MKKFGLGLLVASVISVSAMAGSYQHGEIDQIVVRNNGEVFVSFKTSSYSIPFKKIDASGDNLKALLASLMTVHTQGMTIDLYLGNSDMWTKVKF